MIVQSLLLTLVFVFNLCDSRTEKRRISPEIIGGVEAKRGEFPYIVVLGKLANGEVRHFCGGAIIAKRTVITAAHCVAKPKPMAVIAGVHELKVASGNEVMRPVRETLMHPNFKLKISQWIQGIPPEGYGDDIALLFIDEPWPFDRTNIKAMHIISRQRRLQLKTGTPLITTGWGRTHRAEARRSPVLLKTTMAIFDQQECDVIFRKLYNQTIDDRMFCGFSNGSSPCKGDSGGPVVPANEPNVLVGLVSFGWKTCSKYPAVFTDVSFYSGWINENKIE